MGGHHGDTTDSLRGICSAGDCALLEGLGQKQWPAAAKLPAPFILIWRSVGAPAGDGVTNSFPKEPAIGPGRGFQNFLTFQS